MSEVTRVTYWKGLSYEARVSINGPTTIVYNTSNLPILEDPGWSDWKSVDGKQSVRMICIHGPFNVEGREDFDRCEDGWLAMGESGSLSVVDSEYVKPSLNSSELEETARPYGYRRAE